MTGRTLTDRVEILEKKVESLDKLPGQVAALREDVASLSTQFLQFRAETRVAFSASREELTERMGRLHEIAMGRMLDLHEVTLTRVDELHGDVLTRVDELHEVTLTRVEELHGAVLTRVEELHGVAMAQMSGLQSDLASRIGALAEMIQGTDTKQG